MKNILIYNFLHSDIYINFMEKISSSKFLNLRDNYYYMNIIYSKK